VTNASGAVLSQQRYLPFGQVRTDVGRVSETDFGYTGQRAVSDLGLMDYHARMYDPLLMRFVQPDSIIPGVADPQTWDRYSYVYNNPVDLTDPTGNFRNCRDKSGYQCKITKKKVNNLESLWKREKEAAQKAAAQIGDTLGGTFGGGATVQVENFLLGGSGGWVDNSR
jgi:RHS repeat-associated protein